MKKIIFVALLLSFGLLFFRSTWAQDQDRLYTVCELGVEGIDDVFLKPCEAHIPESPCPAGGWIHWKLNTPAGKGKLSNATTALISGNNIVVRFQGCSYGFNDAYMVRIKK